MYCFIDHSNLKHDFFIFSFYKVVFFQGCLLDLHYIHFLKILLIIFLFKNLNTKFNLHLYLCNQCLSPLMLWVRISIRARCTTLCDKVCQWLHILLLQSSVCLPYGDLVFSYLFLFLTYRKYNIF
jgi:hypothetical protein